VSGYNYSNSDDDFVGQDNGGSGLRKMLEQVLEENKKLRELVEGDKRQATVTDLLKSKGLDPAIAELIPEGQEPKEWLEKYAHLLGVKEAPELLEDAPGSPPEVIGIVQDDPALDNEREALAAMLEAEETGSPASVSPELLNQMDKIQTEEELMKFFADNGAHGTF
jgi:hypothetical protein